MRPPAEQTLAEQKLADALEALVSADSVAVVIGTDDSIEFASPSALGLLGRTGEDPTTIHWLGAAPTTFGADDDDAMREAMILGTSRWVTRQFLRADDSLVTADVLVIALQRDPFRWMALLRRATEDGLSHDAAIPVAGALLRLARRLAGAGSSSEVVDVAQRLLAPALGASSVTFGLIDETPGLLRIPLDAGSPDDGVERGVTIPTTSATILGDAVLRNRELVCHDLAELATRYPEQLAEARNRGVVAIAAAPMRDAEHDRLVGALQVSWTDPGKVDLALLRACADLVGNAVALAHTVDFDKRAAVAFQQMLLPASSALRTRYDVAVRYRAVDEVVGGDFYDVIERGEVVWLVVGDVVGHGLGAARTMGKVRFFVRALAAAASSATDLLTSVNDLLLDEKQFEIVTCLVVRFDASAGAISVASAGHPPPIALISDQPASQLAPEPLPPLGVRGWPRDRSDLVAPAPRRLVAFTDGLVERRDESIDDGVARILAILDEHADEGVGGLADLLLESNLSTTDDDAAVLCIEFDRQALDG